MKAVLRHGGMLGRVVRAHRVGLGRVQVLRAAQYHSQTSVGPKEHGSYSHPKWRIALGACVTGLACYWVSQTNSSCESEEEQAEPLPKYSRAEVAKHKTLETGIWVIFKDGVYDITEFVEQHPGGIEKIMLAAGSNVDPFWRMYQQHNVPHIREMLEMFRIGDLVPEDIREEEVIADPYANDPERNPLFTVNAQKPFNAEPPLEALSNTIITPNDLFFVRNHLPVPDIDPKQYVLEITGEGITTPIRLTLDDLKKFPKQDVTAVIQCAGNRRSELNPIRPVKGLGWGPAAISNAKWSGVYLGDVLRAYGIEDKKLSFRHVQFEGYDKDIQNVSYGGSIPADIYERTNVLLAYEMNDAELPRDHGFPVRAVVPGVVGARNVKWLAKVILSQEESKAFWQQYDYKGFSPSVTWDNVDYSTSPAIQELPVTSAICEPKSGATLSSKEVTVKGYAWSGGGKGIVRVDVSVDGGKTWHVANLKKEDQPRGKEYGWTLWQAKLPVEEDNLKEKKLDIVCKAVDSSYNTQPEVADHIWNFRGVLCNSWHRVDVKLDTPTTQEQ